MAFEFLELRTLLSLSPLNSVSEPSLPPEDTALAEPNACELQGMVWNDLNGNGLRDSEPGLAAWTVFLDTNQNGQLDAGETSALSDATGGYLFPNLAPGSYTIAEVPPAGWEQTAPIPSTHSVTLAAGQSIQNLDFGNWQPAAGQAFPVPLSRRNPAASLVYDGTVDGALAAARETDRFTIDLDGGQTVTLVVDPLSPGLSPQVSLSGPAGHRLATAA